MILMNVSNSTMYVVCFKCGILCTWIIKEQPLQSASLEVECGNLPVMEERAKLGLLNDCKWNTTPKVTSWENLEHYLTISGCKMMRPADSTLPDQLLPTINMEIHPLTKSYKKPRVTTAPS